MNILPNLQINIYNYENAPRQRAARQEGEEIQLMVEYETILPTGLRIEDLNQFTTLSVFEEGNETCSICRSSYGVREIIRKLNHCQHYFHQKCVDVWLHRNATCPMCRINVVYQN